jgi:hypothetical protein
MNEQRIFQHTAWSRILSTDVQKVNQIALFSRLCLILWALDFTNGRRVYLGALAIPEIEIVDLKISQISADFFPIRKPHPLICAHL